MAVPASLNLPEDLARALKDVVRTIVAIAQPELVILFGPWAEGGAHEDRDLMVIADTERRPMLAVQLSDVVRPALRPRACGLVVIRTEDWPKYSQTPGFLMHDVDQNGVKLYERPA